MEADLEFPALPYFKSSLRRPVNVDIEELEKNLSRIYNEAEVERKEIERICGMTCFNILEDNHEFKISFPILEDYKTFVDLEGYSKSYLYFTGEQNQKRSDGHRHEYNMLDYFLHYNSLDTEVLIQAMTNYRNSSIESFNVNPLEYMGIPGLAGKCMFNSWDDTMGPPTSFHADYGNIFELFRQNIKGGLSAVFHRHAEINGDTSEFGPEVHFAKSGKQYKYCWSFDHNALYPYAYGLNLPTGAGAILEKNKNGFFTWSSMLGGRSTHGCRKGWSYESIEWINEMQHSPPFSQGDKKYQIQHKLSKGEKRIKTANGSFFEVDGYCQIEDEIHILEYQGNYSK